MLSPIISLNDITVEKEGRQILMPASFSAYAGDFITISGPSGSGKTTLLNIIGALDSPTKGEIIWNFPPKSCDNENLPIYNQLENKDFSHHDRPENVSLPIHNRLEYIRRYHLGFIFQFHNLLAELSTSENIAVPLIIRGAKPHIATKKANAFLDENGSSRLKNRSIDTLSGGEKQIISVLRAAIAQPSLILADEPTGALDSKSAADIFELLYSFTPKGITVIIVTHNQELAKMGKRKFVLNDGKLNDHSVF